MMTQRIKARLAIGIFLSLFLMPTTGQAESQGSEYKGITDPFGDPTAYEFAEDEKEDKEFFHLGRYLMFGVDLGLGSFTGGLGTSNASSFNVGGRLVYFFDKCLAFEAAIHYARHTDAIIGINTGNTATIDNTLMPITASLRYYFDVKNAPRAIAVANPYLVLGGGAYIRTQTVLDSTFNLSSEASDTATGVHFGGGGEFLIYRRNIYMGLDLRYHAVFFADEDETFGDRVEPGARGGDYFTGAITLTYSF